jgi:hypothetical protein
VSGHNERFWDRQREGKSTFEGEPFGRGRMRENELKMYQ